MHFSPQSRRVTDVSPIYVIGSPIYVIGSPKRSPRGSERGNDDDLLKSTLQALKASYKGRIRYDSSASDFGNLSLSQLPYQVTPCDIQQSLDDASISARSCPLDLHIAKTESDERASFNTLPESDEHDSASKFSDGSAVNTSSESEGQMAVQCGQIHVKSDAEGQQGFRNAAKSNWQEVINTAPESEGLIAVKSGAEGQIKVKSGDAQQGFKNAAKSNWREAIDTAANSSPQADAQRLSLATLSFCVNESKLQSWKKQCEEKARLRKEERADFMVEGSRRLSAEAERLCEISAQRRTLAHERELSGFHVGMLACTEENEKRLMNLQAEHKRCKMMVLRKLSAAEDQMKAFEQEEKKRKNDEEVLAMAGRLHEDILSNRERVLTLLLSLDATGARSPSEAGRGLGDPELASAMQHLDVMVEKCIASNSKSPRERLTVLTDASKDVMAIVNSISSKISAMKADIERKDEEAQRAKQEEEFRRLREEQERRADQAQRLVPPAGKASSNNTATAQLASLGNPASGLVTAVPPSSTPATTTLSTSTVPQNNVNAVWPPPSSSGGGMTSQIASQSNVALPAAASERLSDTGDKLQVSDYSCLQNLLDKCQTATEELRSSAQLKQLKMDLQMTVNTIVNAVSDASAAHLRDKLDRLLLLLAGERVKVMSGAAGPRYIVAKDHPSGVLFCKELLARKVVEQGDKQVKAKHEAAFAFAAVAAGVIRRHPDFGELLRAHFYRACPYLVPCYPPLTGAGGDNVDCQGTPASADRPPSTGGGEAEEEHDSLARMSGYTRLYFATFVVSLGETSRAWAWLAAAVRLQPRRHVTATLFGDVLDVTAYVLQDAYGMQFRKLLQLLIERYLPKLRAASVGAAGGPMSRLELLLQKAVGARGVGWQPPAGVLPPELRLN